MPTPSSLPPLKRRKTASSDDTLKRIESLESSLVASLRDGGSLNAFVDLLELARSTADAVVLHKILYALYRSTVSIAASSKLDSSKCRNEESKLVRSWLLDRLGEYADLLSGLMADEEKALRTAAVQIHMSTLKHLSSAFSNASGTPQIYSVQFKKIVRALLVCAPTPRGCNGGGGGSTNEGEGRRVEADIRDSFVGTWLSSYDDIRWFFLREATSLLRSHGDNLSVVVAENLLPFLEQLKTMPTEAAELNAFWIPELGAKPPKPTRSKEVEDDHDEPALVDEDDWRTFFDDSHDGPSKSKSANTPRVHTLSTHQSLHSLASHRAQFSACWMALLPHIASSGPLATRALGVMHRGVMPHMDKPVRLMDWVGGCVDFGEYAADGDYPDFYTRLYAFLTRDVMHLKYRARFFRLTDVFLSSTQVPQHLPVGILASFVKRLTRLSLTAPPAAIVMIIPFVYNILKRHPSLMVMIHRIEAIDAAEIDPFDEAEPSPLRTNAIDSSLWELVSHRNHYLSSVSTLAKIFSEVFTKPAYALEDFLDHTYATLLETEVKRKLKKDPAVALEAPANLFPLTESDDTPTGDVVSELWVF